MKKIVLLSSSLLVIGLLAGCGAKEDGEKMTRSSQTTATSTTITTSSTAKEDKKQDEPLTIETDFGTFEVTVPTGWESIDPTEVNDSADLALENADKDMYMMILSTPEELYENFDEFLGMYGPEDVVDTVLKEEPIEEIKEANWTGERRMFTGEVDETEVFYVYDLLYSANGHYVQRLSWTSAVHKNQNLKALKEIGASVKDVSDPTDTETTSSSK